MEKKHSILRTIIYIVAILIALFIVTNISLRIATKHNSELSTPNFQGISLQEAQQMADDLQIRLDVTDSVYIKGMARGMISKQNPKAGSKVKKNRRILLTINSIQPKMVEMPNLIGLSLRQAKTEIHSSGLTLGKLIYTEDMATNNVLYQEYQGYDIMPGADLLSESVIDLVLGMNLNDASTYIPNVIGYEFITAKDIIHNNSLNIHKISFDDTVTDYADSLEAFVYRQYPMGSDSISYKLGTYIDIFLTKDKSRLNDAIEF